MSASRADGWSLAAKWRLLVLGPNRDLVEQIRLLLVQQAPSSQVFQVVSYPEQTQVSPMLSQQPLSLILLDCSSAPEKALALVAEVERINPDLPVLALLEREAPDLILRCLRGGAVDFLAAPFDAAHVESVFRRLAQSRPHLASGITGARLIVTVPARGGCGATSVGMNLAFHKKHFAAKPMAFLDLDPLTGSVAFLLKVRAQYTFLDAVVRGATLDHDVWRSLVQTVRGVDLLLAPDDLTEASYQLEDPVPILNFARGQYGYVVADVASPYSAWALRALLSADDIVLVTTPDPAGRWSSERALQHLSACGARHDRIRLVLNQCTKKSEEEARRWAETVGVPVASAIPNDTDALRQAMLEARPISPGADFGKGIATLAAAITGASGNAEPPAEKATKSAAPSPFGSLLGLFGRKA